MNLIRLVKLGSQAAGKRGLLDKPIPLSVKPEVLARAQKAFAAKTEKLKGKGTQIETAGSLDEKKLAEDFKKATSRSAALGVPVKEGLIPMGAFIQRKAPYLYDMLASSNKAVRAEGNRILKLSGDPMGAFGTGPKGSSLLSTNRSFLDPTVFINAPGRDAVIAQSRSSSPFIGPLTRGTQKFGEQLPSEAFPASLLNKKYSVTSQRDVDKLQRFENWLILDRGHLHLNKKLVREILTSQLKMTRQLVRVWLH